MSDITCVLVTPPEAGLKIGDDIQLTAEESHHVSRVRRMRTGDEVWAVTGTGKAYRCLLRDADPVHARLEILEVVPQWGEPARSVTLYQGLIRSHRMEQIVEQGTAIGMRNMVPLITERVERHGLKLDRLRRITGETSKQCCRGWIPSVEGPLQWNEFLQREKELTLLVADAGAGEGLADFIRSERMGLHDDIGIVIGPEGGLTDAELEAITGQGGITVHLGRRRLRSETAASVSLSLLLIGAEYR